MDQWTLLMREFVSSLWLAATLYFVFLFGRYWVVNRRLGDLYTVRASLAFVIYFSGSLIARAWGWLNLRFLIDGPYPEVLNDSYPFVALCSIASLIGALWLTSIFSPKAWGHWGWIGAVLTAVAFLIVTRLVGASP